MADATLRHDVETVCGPAPSRSASRPDAYSLITGACEGARTTRGALEAVLEVLEAHFAAVAVVVSASVGTDELEVVREPGVGAERWLGALRAEALEVRARCRPSARLYGRDEGRPEAVLLGAPLGTHEGEAFGAVAMVASCRSAEHAEAARTELRSLCGHLARVLQTPRAVAAAPVSVAEIARVLARCGEYQNIRHFSHAVAGAVRAKLGCEQAAVGLVRGGHVRVRVVSGLDEVRRRSPGVHRIEQAMGECLDSGVPVICQAGDPWSDGRAPRSYPLHERWRAGAGSSAVATIPVFAGDRCVAVVALRKQGERAFGPHEIEDAQKLLGPIGVALPLVEQATLGVAGRAMESVRRAGAASVRRGGWGKKIMALLAVALVAWVCLGTMAYRVSVPTTVRAEREHVVSAPETARLSEVLVMPGDRVEAGQVVARLETHALLMARDELAAEIRGLDMETRRLTGAGDAGGAAIVAARGDVARARLRAVVRRVEECELRSVVAGVVLGPPLKDRVGEVVAGGEPLVRVAEAGTILLELRIPERRVTDMALGSRVVFLSHARPEEAFRTTLGTVSPSAEVREGRQAFIGEATVPGSAAWLRPGMEGVASVEAGDRRVWWVAFNRLIDFVHLELWPQS